MRPRAFKCTHCNYSSFEAGTLKIHIMRHTELYRSHKCNQCSGSFTTMIKLKAHKVSHVTEKPYKCTICDHENKRKYQFKKHMATVHSGYVEIPLQCNLCIFTSNFASRLRSHMESTHHKSIGHDG